VELALAGLVVMAMCLLGVVQVALTWNS